MAERVGFEPTVPVRVQQFSRLPDSTTLAPLLINGKCKVKNGKFINVRAISVFRFPFSVFDVFD